MTFKVIKKTHTNEELIKKSTFIGVCAHIESTQDFEQFLHKHQDITATHNCWAYRMGNTYRFNDDGEPSGTAGKPILAAIDGAGYDHLAALVIRYYGGIKLGTGGLARAYGGIIAKNLQVATYSYFIPTTEINLQLDFDHSQQLFKITADHEGTVGQQAFNEKGVLSTVTIPIEHLNQFKNNLLNASKGSVQFLDND